MPSRSLSAPKWFGKRVAATIRAEVAANYAGNQTTLGQALGISQQQVSQLLLGAVVINVDQLQLLCDELGLSSQAVMSDAEQAWRARVAEGSTTD